MAFCVNESMERVNFGVILSLYLCIGIIEGINGQIRGKNAWLLLNIIQNVYK